MVSVLVVTSEWGGWRGEVAGSEDLRLYFGHIPKYF